jgi:hypothetical protein
MADQEHPAYHPRVRVNLSFRHVDLVYYTYLEAGTCADYRRSVEMLQAQACLH